MAKTQHHLTELSIQPVELTSAEPKGKADVEDVNVLTDSAEVTSLTTENDSQSMLWITVQDIILTEDDKQTIRNGEMRHINCAQRLISQQFLGVNGLQLSLIQDKPIKYSQTAKAIQIIHVRKNHWVVAASQKSKSMTPFIQLCIKHQVQQLKHCLVATYAILIWYLCRSK